MKEDDVLLKKRMFKMPVEDNSSPLVTLVRVKPEFMFEPSFIEGYTYLVRKEIVEKLTRINQSLMKENKILVIRSTWRSFENQKALIAHRFQELTQTHPEKTEAQINAMISHFIAPANRSTHTTGGAVDALIYDNATGKILDFGTNEEHNIDLGVKCYPFHPDISEKASANRKLLIDAFEKEDFVVDLKEFWHFDYGNVAWAAAKNKEAAIYGPISN